MNKLLHYIKNKINHNPDLAIVLGSGLADLQNILTNKIVIKYSDIPGYFKTTVKGHEGKFVFGKFKNKYILIAVGRFHYYEGLSLKQVGLPIKIFHALKCKNIIITNSSGCLQSDWSLGDVMIINGHYDFTFRNDVKNPQLISGNDYYNQKLIDLTIKNHPEVKLSVVGMDEKTKKINQENVSFFDIINDQQKLISLYDDNDILILPSYTEGYPMVVLEALSRLRPVIIFKEIKHIIEDKKGIFVADRNYDSLIKTINFIKANYYSIQEDMKQNNLPSNESFIKEIKNIILQY